MKGHLRGDQYAFKIEVYRNNNIVGTYYDWYTLLQMEAVLNDVISYNIYRNIGTLENPIWNSDYYTQQKTIGTDYSLHAQWSISVWARDIPDATNS